ncbi:hypothetical protein WI666_05275 [Vibrio cholerae]
MTSVVTIEEAALSFTHAMLRWISSANIYHQARKILPRHKRWLVFSSNDQYIKGLARTIRAKAASQDTHHAAVLGAALWAAASSYQSVSSKAYLC